jgi:hypothetical protein
MLLMQAPMVEKALRIACCRGVKVRFGVVIIITRHSELASAATGGPSVAIRPSSSSGWNVGDKIPRRYI